MPDSSGAKRIFKVSDSEADEYDAAAHEIAFAAAAAATRSVDELDEYLAELFSPLLYGKGADGPHVALGLAVRRLAMFARSLATGTSASTHPLAASLREHGDLTSLRGEQMVANLETWLQSGGERS
ncbi:hypothetical protein AB0O90_04440 [Microbacterium testaceum]|uniref:hypothetical protein n=1 Tax=Microbacterium testaceum TaxID=2033 RepID=UPI0034166EE9